MVSSSRSPGRPYICYRDKLGSSVNTDTSIIQRSTYFRFQRQSEAGGELKGKEKETGFEDPGTGVEVRRCVVFGLYLQVPYLGPGEADEATRRFAA